MQVLKYIHTNKHYDYFNACEIRFTHPKIIGMMRMAICGERNDVPQKELENRVLRAAEDVVKKYRLDEFRIPISWADVPLTKWSRFVFWLRGGYQ